MTDEEIDAAVDELVDQAPPLSDEQRAKLAQLLAPMREAITKQLAEDVETTTGRKRPPNRTDKAGPTR